MTEKKSSEEKTKEEIADEVMRESGFEDESGEETEKPSKKEEKTFKSENKKLNAKLASLSDENEKLKTENGEITDKYQRVCAEYDNFRKRSAKEKEGIYADAYADALKEILPVIDNLERAAAYSEPEKLTEGIQLIFKSAKEMLEKLGITEFGEKGDTFDPNMHNAVMHIEDESLGEGEITDVFQKGYKKGDRIIRYAMVKVAN